MIGDRAVGRIIHLGGCGVLALPDEHLKYFCRRIHAKGLVGYTKSVEFLETVAFEIMLVRATLGTSAFKPIFTRLCREHPRWTSRLGLRMAHATWASPEGIAQ